MRTVWTGIVVFIAMVALGIAALIVCPFDRRSRYFNWTTYTWSRIWLWAAGVKVTLENQQVFAQLQGQPFFMVGNHQSAVDIPILFVAAKGNVRFAAKKSLFNVPIAGWLMHIYGFTPVDRDNTRKMLPLFEKMVQNLKKHTYGQIIFPEGTRSRDGTLGEYKAGTFKLVTRAGVAVLPFMVDGSYKLQQRDSLQIIPGRVTVRFADPIPAQELAALPKNVLLERVRAHALRYLTATSQMGHGSVPQASASADEENAS